MHARKGNSNSFVADFESRLDRVLYRCNAVPSIFAARMAIGHKHGMVNGKITNSTHYLMKPGDEITNLPEDIIAIPRMRVRERPLLLMLLHDACALTPCGGRRCSRRRTATPSSTKCWAI